LPYKCHQIKLQLLSINDRIDNRLFAASLSSSSEQAQPPCLFS